MASQAVREFALVRDCYRPLDANIKYGRVVVFAQSGSTVTLADGTVLTADDNSVVLPNHANALPRACAGIYQANGLQGNIYVATPLDLYSDNTAFVQKDWLPEAGLAPNSGTITIGDELGYDPSEATNPGTLKRHVDGSTVKCAVAQGTYATSSSVQIILVQLLPAQAFERGGVWSSLAAPGATLTDTTTETALAASASIPASMLSQIKEILIDGMTDITGVNGTDKLIVAGYFHPASVAFGGAGSIKFFTTPTAGGGTSPTVNDQWVQRFVLDLHSATAFVASGARSLGTLGTATMISDGLQGEQVYDSSVAWKITITGKYAAASVSNTVRQQTLTVRLA